MPESSICICGRTLSNKQSLCRHRKICKVATRIDQADALRISDANRLDQLQTLTIRQEQEIMRLNERLNESNTRENVSLNAINELKDTVRELRRELSIINSVYNEYVRTESQTKQRLFEEERKDRKEVTTSAGNLVGKSLSTIDYLSKHMTNAPVLAPIIDMSVLKNGEEGNHALSDIAIHHCKKKTLHQYIGNVIISEYKNEDEPGKQSLWTSDVARLSYVIRQKIGNGEAVWIEDKKGLKVKETIIIPLLDYLKKEMNTRIQKVPPEGVTPSQEDIQRLWEAGDVLQQIGNIRSRKEISKLAQRINRYIAGHFCLDKTNSKTLTIK